MVVSSVIPALVTKVDTVVRLTLPLSADPMRAVAVTRNLGGALMGAVQNGDHISVSFNIGSAITKFWDIAASGIATGIERVIDIIPNMGRLAVDILNRLEDLAARPVVSRVILQRLPESGGVQLEIDGTGFDRPGDAEAEGTPFASIPSTTWVVLGNPVGDALELLTAKIIASETASEPLTLLRKAVLSPSGSRPPPPLMARRSPSKSRQSSRWRERICGSCALTPG